MRILPSQRIFKKVNATPVKVPQQYSSTAIQEHNSTEVQKYSSTAVQQYHQHPSSTIGFLPAPQSDFLSSWHRGAPHQILSPPNCIPVEIITPTGAVRQGVFMSDIRGIRMTGWYRMDWGRFTRKKDVAENFRKFVTVLVADVISFFLDRTYRWIIWKFQKLSKDFVSSVEEF